MNRKDCAGLVSGAGWGALAYFKVSSTLKKMNKRQSRFTKRLGIERCVIDPLLSSLSLHLRDCGSNLIQR